jgi:DNA-binding transcriptional LysR family regulator
MHYDLVDLRVFLAVAEEGSLSGAARRCNLSLSSVSLRLKGLEESLHTPLFRRQARGVTLTGAGTVMLEHVRRCTAQLMQMHADLEPFAKGIGGHITLFANNNAISSHLPDDLARFFAAYPSVRISLEERLSIDIVSAVASGRADVGVVARTDATADLCYWPYRDDHLVLLAPMQGELGKRKSVRFAECLHEPFISLHGGAALHTFLVNHANALGEKLDIRVQVSGYRAIARLVASGAGVGVVPRSALEAWDHEHLAVVELAEPWAHRQLQICVRQPASDMNPYVRHLVDTLRHDEEARGETGEFVKSE